MAWFKKVGTSAAEAPDTSDSNRTKPGSPPNQYEGLRNLALNSKARELGLDLPDDSVAAYGVVMDMGLSRGTATLVAFSTGDASMYFSTGGGVIGGGMHETVRQRAKALVSEAPKYLSCFHPAAGTDCPVSGDVQFFILTNRGTLVAMESEEQLKSESVPLSQFYFAAHRLINEVRLVAQRPNS